MNRTDTLEVRAHEFAAHVHGRINHRRKYTGEPYIAHPEAVAEIVRSVPHDEVMIAAALLHDTREDCGVTNEEIFRRFGLKVASLVDDLTDVSKPTDGNRAVRKEIDRQHTAKASPRAKTIKLADLINNTESIVAHDPWFARTYLREKARLLDVLREGDATLWQQAYELLRAACGSLGVVLEEELAPLAPLGAREG